jgi:hypothetical protein
VKVRQGRPKRTEDQQANQGKQMTEGVMGPCSPAERGTSCNRLCCASTGAPWNGYSYLLACNLSVTGSNWKAQCGESRMLRLDGGKGRETLPIRTPNEHVHERSLVRAYANTWLGMAMFPTYPKCPDAARTSSQVSWLLHIMQVANGLHDVQQDDKRSIDGAACSVGRWVHVVPTVPSPTSAGIGTPLEARWRRARALPRRRSGRPCRPR